MPPSAPVSFLHRFLFRCGPLAATTFAAFLVVSEPPAALAATPAPALETGIEVLWDTTASNTYQLQTRPAAGAAWADLGAVVNGDGSSHVVYQPGRDAAREFQVLETYPVFVAPPAVLANGDFEAGSGTTATGWSVAASQPPQRVSTAAHGGTFSMRCALLNVGSAPAEGILQQTVLPAGTAGVAGQAYTFSFWMKQVSSGPSYIQQYWLQWLNTSGGIIGGTGLQNFNGTIGQWTQVNVANQTAPAGVAGVKIVFRLVTGAVAGGFGEVLIDDVAVTPVGAAPVTSTAVRALPVNTRPAGRLSWPSEAGTRYTPEASPDLLAWTALPPALDGTGEVLSLIVPLTRNAEFFRVGLAAIAVEPPSGLRLVASGQADSVGLAWDASPTVGVTGYRILYGLAGGALDQTLEVGAVTSAVVPGLAQGSSYQFSLVALLGGASSPASTGTVTASPEAGLGLDALFSPSTTLEPAVLAETSTALVTRLADRARDRHAREAIFNSYDHYLTFYWEQRVANIEILDQVAKGGTKLIFNYTTQARLNPAEFRAFFRGLGTVAEYHHNVIATFVSSHPSIRYPGETDYNYTATLETKLPENRPLQLGDRVEIEISQFLESVRNGRLNYYGTTFLYMVGQGVVPWYEEKEYVTGGSIDSRPLPPNAWLGGLTTLPYQYSDEPEHRFKQTAGNIAPESGQPFMLGRRLHHTDFLTGAHTEPGNPVFTPQIGKVGPKFVAQSCVDCHVNNGRALPPAVGASLLQSVVKVSADGHGTPHPILGEELQPRSTVGAPEGGVTLAGYDSIPGTYGDGTAYTLRRPTYAFTGATPTYFSVRVAPQLVGLGLLEAVTEETIAALADPGDANGDGISGRMQLIPDPEDATKLRLGRFTYKGGQARVSHQIAYALNRDMSVTTALFPVLDGETVAQAPEINATELEQLTRYVSLLGVGARRALTDPIALRGEQVFQAAGCVSCHTPSLPTGPYHPYAELRGQTIRPYTDLLLHDLGAGLADNLGEEAADGAEWRTAPLWNIGLTAGVSGGEAYLHDGRARTLEEAILWHGGEAEAAKEAFRTAPASDRAALVKFLKSL
jgi:CxxC motif-containing protein (DUF1111 family)